jgi:hypothetical protein
VRTTVCCAQDTLLIVHRLPYFKLIKCRTLANSTLWNMVMLGTVVRSCGHFPVKFAKADEDNNFKTDESQRDRLKNQLDNRESTSTAPHI